MNIRILLAVFTLAMLPALSFAQGNQWCGFDQRFEEQMTDPAIQEKVAEQEARLQEYIARQRANRNSEDERYVIPTVVHVIHDNGVGNISQEQVEDAIRTLNEDFQHRNADRSETRAEFVDFAGCADFEFRLARLDPQGNTTNGIVRVSDPNTTYDADNSVKQVSWWAGADYFNIWVVNTIESSGADGIILGYAQFPGNGSWNAGYGVVIRHDRFGTIGTGNGDRTMTHEAGHCFDLYHTFQSGCGGNCSNTGDRVCDTPPVDDSTQGCDEDQNTCANDAIGASAFTIDVVDQIENFMSYDNCQNMFSEGQVERMRAVVATNNTLAGLVSDNNLAQTGVDQLYSADFRAPKRIVCTGEPTLFEDASQFGQTGWDWQFPGASPSVATNQYPEVTYYEPGIYDVVLAAGNDNGTLSELKTEYIFAVPTVGAFMPFEDSFEQEEFPSADWMSFNEDNSAFGWESTTDAAYSGTKSLRMRNFGNTAGAEDVLVSSTVDLSTLSNASISFRYAYAQRANGDQDELRLYISTNCGESWSPRWGRTGVQLATVNPTNTDWTPSGESDWMLGSVSLSTGQLVENLLIRFEFESDQGNNLFLDDINIQGDFDPVPNQVFPFDGQVSLPDELTLDWKAVGNVDGYTVQLDTTPGFTSALFIQSNTNYISASPNNADTEHEVLSLLHGETYYWRVSSETGNVASDWSDTWQFTVSDNGVNVGELSEQTTTFSIYPNPATEASVIEFSVAAASDADLRVYDLTGREVALLCQQTDIVGTKRYQLNKIGLNPGVYLARLQINNDIRVSKFLVK